MNPEDFLGRPLAAVDLASFRPGSISVVEEIEGVVYVDNTTAGIGVQADRDDGVVTTIVLYNEGEEDYEAFPGVLPHGLQLSMSREALCDALGPPSISGEAQFVPILGDVNAWDRWDGLASYAIHCLYVADESAIARVTIMADPPAVPASHFIDALLGHLGHDYYVALLSAAEVHGFAHQRPQVFQVITPARLRDRVFDRARIEFITAASIAGRAVDTITTPTGTMRVSTIETTVLDLVAHQHESGGLSNVATIIGEMLEDIDTAHLAEVATAYPNPIAQRAGWLLDFMADQMNVDVDTDPMAALASGRRSVLLTPGAGRKGERDKRWGVIVNAHPESEA